MPFFLHLDGARLDCSRGIRVAVNGGLGRHRIQKLVGSAFLATSRGLASLVDDRLSHLFLCTSMALNGSGRSISPFRQLGQSKPHGLAEGAGHDRNCLIDCKCVDGERS